MDIKARINGRKVVLYYFFQKYFTESLSAKDMIFQDIIKADKSIMWTNPTAEDLEEIKSQVKNYYDAQNSYKDANYIISNFFENENSFDNEYIQKMIDNFDVYKDEVAKRVNALSLTFKFDEMDIMDKAIFTLGLVEFKLGISDKNLVLNEMIELAKRFGDGGSAKLINGIGDKLIVV